MKSFKKKIAILTLLILMGILALNIFQTKAKQSIIAEYKTMNSKEILVSLSSLGKEDFFEVLQTVFQKEETMDSEALIPFAVSWAERCNQFSADDYRSIIMDETNQLSYRLAAIDIYTSNYYKRKTEQVNAELIRLLDKDVEGEIKTYLIQGIPLPEEKLEELFLNEKDVTAFWALKMLGYQNIERASKISEKFLEDENVWKADKEKVNAAIGVAEERCHIDESKKEKTFQQLKNIVEKQSKINKKVVESALFSLSDLKYDKALSFLINSDKVEKDKKIYAIGENTDTLEKMVETRDEQDIMRVCTAMEICPEYSVLVKLENAEGIKDEKVKQKLDGVLKKWRKNK